jgi:hypothetical protein
MATLLLHCCTPDAVLACALPSLHEEQAQQVKCACLGIAASAAGLLLHACFRVAAVAALRPWQPSAGPDSPFLDHMHLRPAQRPHRAAAAACCRAICSAIDKLDKAEWPEVRQEMVEDKGCVRPQNEQAVR